jgi:hypothetical protein
VALTDARLPAEWLTDPRFDALSDRAYRTFCGSLQWANEQGTDGLLTRRSLRFFHPEGVDAATLGELIDSGLWAPVPKSDSVCVPNWEGMGQELASTVEWRKKQARERQRKFREAQGRSAKKKGPRSEVVTDDVDSDVTRDVGQERTETVTGTETGTVDRITGEVADAPVRNWKTRTPGQGRLAS